jgi:hypothetical protein
MIASMLLWGQELLTMVTINPGRDLVDPDKDDKVLIAEIADN